jgi:hypothetical protein
MVRPFLSSLAGGKLLRRGEISSNLIRKEVDSLTGGKLFFSLILL